jgi:hypothetical protein
MSTRNRGSKPRPWLLIAAIAGPPVILASLLLPSMLAGTGSASNNLWVGTSAYGPTSKAPRPAVEIVHKALHDIGTQCRRSVPQAGVITSDVTLIIAFSAKYPVGRFPIDDETATPSTLLGVTGDALQVCAPEELARIERARSTLPKGN